MGGERAQWGRAQAPVAALLQQAVTEAWPAVMEAWRPLRKALLPGAAAWRRARGPEAALVQALRDKVADAEAGTGAVEEADSRRVVHSRQYDASRVVHSRRAHSRASASSATGQEAEKEADGSGEGDRNKQARQGNKGGDVRNVDDGGRQGEEGQEGEEGRMQRTDTNGTTRAETAGRRRAAGTAGQRGTFLFLRERVRAGMEGQHLSRGGSFC